MEMASFLKIFKTDKEAIYGLYIYWSCLSDRFLFKNTNRKWKVWLSLMPHTVNKKLFTVFQKRKPFMNEHQVYNNPRKQESKDSTSWL